MQIRAKSPGVADQLIYQHQGYSSMLTNKVHNYCPRRSSMEPFYVYSLNPQYPYGEKNDDDHVQVIGKVIGTVSADEIPDEEDSAILKDLKSEELYEFEREDGIPL